ncbi:MAG: NADH-quinone oxidoreductase subunit NuoK [Planctomycetes bacterium]|nr:NADH-quinone oxidoreductase subunit NuoK [Planctomycetota bacterium]
MDVSINLYLALGALLFGIGVTGFLYRRNAIVMFMSVELMLNAANLTLVAFSRMHGLNQGTIYALFIITVAAAEAAVGLAIVVALFKLKDTVNVDEFDQLKG